LKPKRIKKLFLLLKGCLNELVQPFLLHLSQNIPTMNTRQTSIKVKKNNGDLVPFENEKLKRALRNSGASENEVHQVVLQVEQSIYEGITTKKIYQIAYRILYKNSHRSAGRYRLKKALQQMGPTGYPFEHFVSRIFQAQGYDVQTGILVAGQCVQHEMDVVGKKNEQIIMAECKFHRAESAKSDVKVSLYVHSRMEDIKARLEKEGALRNTNFVPYIITNTRFTEDAEQYGRCAGLNLISWDFPAGSSLKDLIDQNGFHPITSIKALTQREKNSLMEEGIVLCREVEEKPECLEKFHIPQSRLTTIQKEIRELIRKT